MRQEILDIIREFTADREWEIYYTAVNLAKFISTEEAELRERVFRMGAVLS